MRTPKQKTSAQKRYEQLKSRGLWKSAGAARQNQMHPVRHQRQQVGAELVLP